MTIPPKTFHCYHLRTSSSLTPEIYTPSTRCPSADNTDKLLEHWCHNWTYNNNFGCHTLTIISGKSTLIFTYHSVKIVTSMYITLTLSRNTNKMQFCNRIYYSKVYWRFNMFREAHRSSSGALNCICRLWFIYPCGDRPLPRLGNGRSPHGHINQRLQIQFRAPDDDRCAARNMLSLQ